MMLIYFWKHILQMYIMEIFSQDKKSKRVGSLILLLCLKDATSRKMLCFWVAHGNAHTEHIDTTLLLLLQKCFRSKF